MKLPHADHAIIDIRKIRDYVLNPKDPRGRHKARVFLSALGFSQTDFEELISEILNLIKDADAIIGELDIYGQRYTVDYRIKTESGEATVRTGWIVKRGESIPRMTTCYVMKEK